MIKKLYPLLLSIIAVSCALSCGGEHSDGKAVSSITLKDVIKNNVHEVICQQYEVLATRTDTFTHVLCDLVQPGLTQKQMEQVCRLFLDARGAYERSESFFFGANAHFNVDTDINSWPLDLSAFQLLMQGEDNLRSVNGWPTSLVGWHGVEYVLFRNGKERDAADVTSRELLYAQTLAKNICLRCFQLYCGWDAKAPDYYREALISAGLPYLSPLGGNYSDYMLTAYSTLQAVKVMLTGDNGMLGLVDEIARTKLGEPFGNDDSHYIESPYSHTSIEDLRQNLSGVEDLWYGRHDNAFDVWFKKRHPELRQKMEQALNSAKLALNNIPEPFVKNYGDLSVKKAIEAMEMLRNVLEEVNAVIQKGNED